MWQYLKSRLVWVYELPLTKCVHFVVHTIMIVGLDIIWVRMIVTQTCVRCFYILECHKLTTWCLSLIIIFCPSCIQCHGLIQTTACATQTRNVTPSDICCLKKCSQRPIWSIIAGCSSSWLQTCWTWWIWMTTLTLAWNRLVTVCAFIRGDEFVKNMWACSNHKIVSWCMRNDCRS